MAYFDKTVYPAIEYYKNKSRNRLIKINGEPAIEEVHKEIIKKVFND